MKIKVKVVTNADKNKVTTLGEKLKVYVKSSPVKGKANKELIELLSDYYNVPKTSVAILKGEKSKHKLIEISKE